MHNMDPAPVYRNAITFCHWYNLVYKRFAQICSEAKEAVELEPEYSQNLVTQKRN